MSFRDAMDMVPDDMPDGAFFAMAHEIAGLDYGDGFDELANEPDDETPGKPVSARKEYRCSKCGRKFKSTGSRAQHIRDKGHKV